METFPEISFIKHFQELEDPKCFQSWTSELYQLTKGATIAIDGKTLRRSHNQRNGKKALHIVFSWS